MDESSSVAHLIAEVRVGNAGAVERLWDEYFPRLLRLASHRLGGLRLVVADEEDVALSALKSAVHAFQNGRFPEVADRDSLWRLLSRMTGNKAVSLIRRQLSQRAGGNRRAEADPAGLSELAVEDVTPELLAIISESFEQLLDQLKDSQLKHIALARLEGHTVKRIASDLGIAERTVERRLQLIRETWEQRGLA